MQTRPKGGTETDNYSNNKSCSQHDSSVNGGPDLGRASPGSKTQGGAVETLFGLRCVSRPGGRQFSPRLLSQAAQQGQVVKLDLSRDATTVQPLASNSPAHSQELGESRGANVSDQLCVSDSVGVVHAEHYST